MSSLFYVLQKQLSFGFCVYFEESPAGEGPYSIMPEGDAPILQVLMFP